MSASSQFYLRDNKLLKTVAIILTVVLRPAISCSKKLNIHTSFFSYTVKSVSHLAVDPSIRLSDNIYI